VIPKPLVGRLLASRIDTLCFEAGGNLVPVQVREVLERARGPSDTIEGWHPLSVGLALLLGIRSTHCSDFWGT
jgi:hypothetical protein